MIHRFIHRSPAFWLITLSLGMLVGCSTSEDPRGTRVSVRGEVTLDGKPLDRARIIFRSAQKQSPITATASIVEGKYEIPAERGPLVGEMAVEIHPEIVDLAEFEAARQSLPGRRLSLSAVNIPQRYHSASQLQASVSAAEDQNVFNFELKGR